MRMIRRFLLSVSFAVKGNRGFSSLSHELSEKLSTFEELPGLMLWENFLTPLEQEATMKEAKRASQLASSMTADKVSVVSPAHNIPIRSEYVPVRLPLEPFFQQHDDDIIQKPTRLAEHFVTYGEGHALTYFRGNDNISRLELPNHNLDSLARIPEVQTEVEESRKRTRRATQPHWTWKMTLNYYAATNNDVQQPRRVGFPWHRDLETNGAATFVLALGSPGTLEFGLEPNVDMEQPPPLDNRVERPELIQSVSSPIVLQSGSLLILTGPARWHFVHRVLPNVTSEAQDRASIVLGCW